MLVTTATQMMAKNGAMLPTQTIASVGIALQTRKLMTGAVKNTQTITLTTTALQMIDHLKAMETKAKKTMRAKKTTASPAASTT